MRRYSGVFLAAAIAALSMPLLAADNPFLGSWGFTLPGGGAGWLGITQEKGYYDGRLLWGWGGADLVSSVFFENDTLYVAQVRNVERKEGGKVVRTQQFPEVLICRIEGGELKMVKVTPHENGDGISRDEFRGKRLPAMPPAPDLAKVKFGDAITLFNGKNLDGWKLTDPNTVNGWGVENGLLVNKAVQQEGKPYINFGNLRTEKEFEDFNITLETRVPTNGNSGVFLRGIYEVQVADTFGRKLDPHNMGAVYSRITPASAQEKPPGEWQTMDITLVDRHATVILNGVKIIDNQPIAGPTGGALWPDVMRPGPIYLQGDHTSIEYRNIVLKPVVK
jgi:hypothetical protein